MPFLTWHPYCYICIIPITSQKTYTWLITLGFSDQQQMGKLSHYRSDWQMHWSETQISSKTTCSQRTQKYELQLRVNTASRQQFHGRKFTLLKLTDTIWLQSALMLTLCALQMLVLLLLLLLYLPRDPMMSSLLQLAVSPGEYCMTAT